MSSTDALVPYSDEGKSRELTPIRNELPDTLIQGIAAGKKFGEKSTNIELTQTERDLVRGAIDVYKLSHVETVEQLEWDEEGRDSMKLVGKVEVSRKGNELLVNFVTTAHQSATDGTQWATTMRIDNNPNLDNASSFQEINGDRVIARKEGETKFTIFGDIDSLEYRYGKGNITDQIKKAGFTDIALVGILDLDRLLKSKLKLSPGTKPLLKESNS